MVRWAGRVAWFAGSLLIASLIVFALLNLLPGDLAGVMLGPNASPEAVEALRAHFLEDHRLQYLRHHRCRGRRRGRRGRRLGGPCRPRGRSLRERPRLLPRGEPADAGERYRRGDRGADERRQHVQEGLLRAADERDETLRRSGSYRK